MGVNLGAERRRGTQNASLDMDLDCHTLRALARLCTATVLLQDVHLAPTLLFTATFP